MPQLILHRKLTTVHEAGGWRCSIFIQLGVLTKITMAQVVHPDPARRGHVQLPLPLPPLHVPLDHELHHEQRLLRHCRRRRHVVLANLLVRIHFIFVMIRWTGLAPWEFEAPSPRGTHCFQGGLLFKAHRLCVSLNSRLYGLLPSS